MWFHSVLHEEVHSTIHACFVPSNPLLPYLDDFINLNVTKDNYKKLIELCDYLMVENLDVLVDKIVESFGISIIHEFSDFYRINSKRLNTHNKATLIKAIQLYAENETLCYETYGFSAYWNVSNVTDMNRLFVSCKFNIDISQWNVSNVTNMSGMFVNSTFNGDISQWNVSNVNDMSGMFSQSAFNGDISQWNVSNVNDMTGMFNYSAFNGDISQWNVSKVETMQLIFYGSQFNGDISQWNVSNVTDMSYMFYGSQFNDDISQWNVSNVKDMTDMFEDSKLSMFPEWYD
jgi:surface protein